MPSEITTELILVQVVYFFFCLERGEALNLLLAYQESLGKVNPLLASPRIS